MSKNPQSKDEALEALDFIVNVLKEHERDLDKLISDLATVTDQMGDTSELTGKVDKVEEKINGLQKEVTNLIGCVSTAPKGIPPQTASVNLPPPVTTVTPVVSQFGSTAILRCKQWEDFQSLAAGAQTLSYSYNQEEKMFQVDALKGNQIITYHGSLPRFALVLKAYLSNQLNISEKNILEGVLALGYTP